MFAKKSAFPLDTVISGGQVGADIAALRAAKACGFHTGGWMPKGRRTINGPLPISVFHELNLQETDTTAYPFRTERNVKTADATLVFAYNLSSPGEKLTKRLIQKHSKLSFGVDLEKVGDEYRVKLWGESAVDRIYALAVRSYARHVAYWLKQHEVEILNVAGNANVDIEDCVQGFLMLTFSYYRDMSREKAKDAVQGS